MADGTSDRGPAARLRVVFVADDLGISQGVNDGIAAAARAGNVREASLCVTGAAVEAGVQTARALGVGIGLHLSLTLGRALSGPIRGVTDADGRFRPLRSVLFACAVGAVDRDAIGREIAAQLARLAALGVRPTHANGHHHVHVFPVVREVAFAAMARAGVPWTRLPDELPAVRSGWSATARLLAHFARRSRPLAQRHGLRALPFLGVATEARADFGRRMRQLAARLSPVAGGACEWMVHPRTPDAALQQLDPGGFRRPAADELRALADPGLCAELGCTSIGYAALG